MIIHLLDTLPQAMPLLLRLAVVTTIIPLLAMLGAIALRKASAAARYRVWLTGVLGCLVAIPTAAVLPALVSWETKPTSIELAEQSQAEPTLPPQQPEPDTELTPPPEPGFVPAEPIEHSIQPEPAPITRETASPENTPSERPVLDSPPPEATPLPPEPTTIEPAVSVAAAPAQPTRLATWYLWLGTGPHAAWAVAIWLLGAALLWLRLAMAVVSAQRLVRGGMPLEHPQLAETGTTVRLSDHVRVPMLIGILRPTILLPTGAATWNTERLESALRHERAHILRRDIFWQLVTSITASVLWFQPLIWLAAKRLRVERELACDDLVLATGTPACEYAAHLLDFASQATSQTTSPLTVAMAQPTTVEKRIRSILNPHARRTPLSRLSATAITAVTLLAVAGITLTLPGGNQTTIAEDQAQSPEIVDSEKEEPKEQEASVYKKTIAGRVVDEEGNPVPGATVTASVLHLDESWTRITLTADDQGRFRGTIDPRGRRIIQLTAMSETKSLLGQTSVRVSNDLTGISVEAQPAKRGTVRVVDESGEPIQGAHVGAVVLSSAQGAQRTNFGPRTDNRGEAEILHFPNDRVLQVYAFLDGKGLDYQTLSDRQILTWQGTQGQWESLRAYPEEGVTLVLDGVLPVEVTVTSETEEPMAGVELTADFHPQKSGQMALATSFKLEWEIEGVTDRQGKWSLNSLPHWQRGTVRFQARYKVTDSDLSVDYEHTYSIPGGLAPRPEIGECRIVIPSLDYRVGHLLNPDGSPAVNRHVDWNTRRGRDNQTVTDEQGRFAYFQFDASDEIYVRTADQKQATIVPLDGIHPLPQEIKLRNTTTTKGRLINRETDEPMPKQALIYGIQKQHEDPTYNFAFGLMTDEQGRFTISNLIPKTTYNLGLHQMDDPSPDPIATITPQNDQSIDLGDIRVAAAPAEEAEQPPANENAAVEPDEETQPNTKTIAGQVVNEEGNPVPGIHVHFITWGASDGYRVTDEQGRFEMPRGALPEDDDGSPWMIQALDDPHKHHLFAEIFLPIKELREKENLDQFLNQLTVVVKRPSTAKVRVVDGEGNPVEGANVSGRVGHGTDLSTVTTNGQGEAILKVPGKLPLAEVLAYKRGMGLDYRYFQNLEPGKRHEPPVKEYPAEGVTLVLDGVRPVEVTVQDRQGRPVEGAQVTSQFSVARTREGVDGRMPVAHSPIEHRQLVTDAQGRANFDWFPAWTDSNSTTFQVTSEKHLPTSGRYYFISGRYSSRGGEGLAIGHVPGSGKLVIEVEEPVSIRGTVRDEAGNPVAGIRVAAGNGLSSRVLGATTDIHATTDDQGRYELPVGIHYAYLVTVKDDERVSDTQGPIAIFPDQPVDEVDLTLRPSATRLYGRLTDAEGLPIPNAQIQCRQLYFDTAKLAELGLPTPRNLPQPIRPTITRWVRTDAEGRFEFIVGPGHYAIQHSVIQQGRPSDPRSPSPSFEFQIDDEAERRIDLKVEAPDPPRTPPRAPPRVPSR